MVRGQREDHRDPERERAAMRILITGAAGFIGSHATTVALEAGHEVVTIDGLRYAANPERLKEGAEHRYWDLRSPIPRWLIEELGRFDVVWHFAADSHVDRSLTDPVPFVQGNVAATLNLLEACRNDNHPLGILKDNGYVVQVSTDEVYGPGLEGHAEWSRILPSNPYAASKAAQEAIAISYWRSFGVGLVITNTMNNYGDGQDPEKFIPKAISHLQMGVSMPVHAQWHAASEEWISGSRCWLPVKEHAKALLSLDAALADGRADHLGDRVYQSHHYSSSPVRMNITGPMLSNAGVVRLLAEGLGIRISDDIIEFVDFHSSRPGHDLHYSLDGSAAAKNDVYIAPTFTEVAIDLKALSHRAVL